jgi:MFS family permease
MKSRASFAFLWVGQSLTLFGDVFFIVALITMLYHHTGSVTYTAMVPIVKVSSQFISGVVAPLVIERFRLQRILVFAMLGQTILFLFMTLFCLFWLTPATLSLVFLFVAAVSFLEAWVAPARNSMVPRLVPEDRLVKANGYLATTDQTVQFVGWAVGGTVVAFIGAEQALWLTFGLYILSLTCMCFVRDRTEPVQSERTKANGSKWDSIREGWVTIGEIGSLRTVMMMEVVEGIANGAWMGAILLLYAKDILHRGEEWWGFINAAFLGGSILGGLLVLTFSHWMERRLGSSILLGALLFGVFTLAFGYTSLPWLALVLCVLMGPAGQAKDIAKRTLFQQNVDNERLPKVFSAHGTVLYSTFGLSAFIMAPIADHFGVQMAFVVSAVLYGISVVVGVWNRKSLLENRAALETSHANEL